MVTYSCEKCNMNFFKKSNYIRHMERKNGCTSNNKQCPHCDKTFTRSTGLTAHIPICKVIKNNKQLIKMIYNYRSLRLMANCLI